MNRSMRSFVGGAFGAIVGVSAASAFLAESAGHNGYMVRYIVIIVFALTGFVLNLISN